MSNCSFTFAQIRYHQGCKEEKRYIAKIASGDLHMIWRNIVPPTDPTEEKTRTVNDLAYRA